MYKVFTQFDCKNYLKSSFDGVERIVSRFVRQFEPIHIRAESVPKTTAIKPKQQLIFLIMCVIMIFMKVTEISVSGYRNLKRQKINPSAGLNIFVGDNAQGKTNLIESVYLCAIGKSPRTDKEKDLICRTEDKSYVKVDFCSRYGEGDVSFELSREQKRKIQVNSVPIAKTGELMGYFNCVYFSPTEIRIISQSPAERRRFLDIDLCQTDKNYFYSLTRFNKVLAQRNNLLKTATLDELKESIFVWDKQIAEEGAKIIFKRKNFCKKLVTLADECHRQLSDGQESLLVKYVTQIEGETVAELTKNYLNKLTENFEKDVAARFTSCGCQRDDIMLKINDVDVRTFGSQGQQRTTALSLKLAELLVFKEIIGEYPVLLLDDVLSELDLSRQKRLLRFDEGLQILLTSATELPKELTSETECAIFDVKDGVVTKRS